MLRLMGIFSPIMRELSEMAYQYDRDYIFDSSKFERAFNFEPTSYEEGLRQVIAAEKGK
jgi:nucleoside-diphosphate-sugar epimerase